MTSLRELVGRPVVTSDTAEEVGATEGVVIDPQAQRVVAVHVTGHKGGEFVAWDAIDALGTDAVMVSSRAAVRPARDELEQRAARGSASVLTKRLLDDQGDELGVVDDVEFDDHTGDVAHLHAADRQFDSDRLLGIGSYAVVVRAED